MKDWFEWNNVRCTTYGIHVSEQPPITIPKERSTQITVPGRPGTLNFLEGLDVYDEMLLTVNCWISDPTQIPAIAAWLKGSGTVRFASRPGGFYYARVSNQIAFEKIMRGRPHRSFSIIFRCQPFWYMDNVSDTVLLGGDGDITNPGSVYSEPKVVVHGSDDGELIIGDRVHQFFFGEQTMDITVNTPIQECYTGENNTLCNERMVGDFPILMPGVNHVVFTGGIVSVRFSPNWRFL